MASGCLKLLPVKYNYIVWLDRIVLFPYRSPTIRNLLFPVLMQIFGIFLMIAADPAVEQLLTVPLLTITVVDIFRIVELLQTPVIPAFFLVTCRFCTMLRAKVSHYKRIIDVRLCNIKSPASFLRLSSICDMDIDI